MNKPVKLWYLYDFANSFASIVLIFYYPLILSERGINNLWIGIPTSIATLILLLILPYWGNYSDRTGKRILFIKITSALMVVSLFALAFITQKTQVFNELNLLLLSFFYVMFQICFQGSFAFYSSMLRDITDTESSAKVSGVGLGFGQVGNAVALTLIGPIAGSSILIIGLSGKPLALFIGGTLFALISIPFLKQKELNSSLQKISFSYKGFIKKILTIKKVFFFIVGYSLLSDAILTFQLYLTVYIKKVFDFSDKLVVYAGVAGLVGGVLGGFMANKLSSKLRDEERALRISSLLYAVCFALCAFMPRVTIFVFVVLFLGGVSYGLVFSLARTVYSKISPQDNQGEFFSIFSIFEKAASVVGPIVWLLTFYLLQKFGENIQYRGSILLLMLVCLCGFYFLKKSKKAEVN